MGKSKSEVKVKTAKEFLSDHPAIHSKLNQHDLTNSVVRVMELYAEQQCNVIQELFTKPTKELKPLEDLWRQENPRDKFTVPDMTKFYKWIRLKILPK